MYVKREKWAPFEVDEPQATGRGYFIKGFPGQQGR